MTRAFEHASSGTIALWTGHKLLAWRGAREVVRLTAHHGISFSPAGLALLHGNELVDLASRTPARRRELVLAARWLSNGAALHPEGGRRLVVVADGLHEVRWEKERPLREGADTDDERTTGGRARRLWAGDLSRPIALRGSLFELVGKPLPKARKACDPSELGQVELCEGGRAVVIAGGTRLVVLREGRLAVDLVWREAEALTSATIDAAGRRLFATLAAGVVAFSLEDGRVLAARKLEGLASPVERWREHAVVALQETPGEFRSAHTVVALDPATLAPRGRLAFPPTRAREGALLARADGSLAWLSSDGRPRVLQDPALGPLPTRLAAAAAGDLKALERWWRGLPPRVRAAISSRAGLGAKPRGVELAAARDLDALTLEEPGAADLKALATLPRLRSLTLRARRPLRSLGALGALEGLERLALPGARVADAKGLAGLTRLRELELYEAHLPSFEPLSGLRALERLDLYGTGIRDLAPLAGLTRLRRLRVGNCPDLTSLAPLARLECLEDLDASHTGVEDLAPLRRLPALGRVLLEGLDHLKPAMTALRRARPQLRVETAE